MILKHLVEYSEIDSISENGLFSTKTNPNNLINITWDVNFQSQIKCGLDSQISHRTKSAGSWKEWRTILDANNYSTYCAPVSHTHSNYISTTASCNKNWIWTGKDEQPAWLWGGSDPNNVYVYNPSNFSVNYANSAGSANSVSWSNVTNKPQIPVFVGSIVVECVKGEISIPFSNVGISTKPSVVSVVVESEQGFASYMYDSSTTYIRITAMKRLIVNTSDHENITPINGNVRLGLVIYQ